MCFYKFNLLRIKIKIILFIGIVSFSNENIAQENKIKTVTAEFKDVPLNMVVNEIAKQTEKKTYFKKDWVEGYYFSGNFKNATVFSALDKVLDKTPFLYITIDSLFYIVSREQVALHLKKLNNFSGSYNQENLKDFVIIGKASDIGRYQTNRITGIVKDGATGETLVGATVQVLETQFYGVSGYSGNYALELPAGKYQVKTSSVGYEDQIVSIKVLEPGNFDVELFEESHALGEVVILSEQVNKNVIRDQMSIIEMDAKAIKQLPSLIGERDIIKSFTTMPGVKTAGEFGSGINVRGGGEDQNLYLLENAPLFNTSHVMGLLSAVNPDAVTGVTLYKGHIPAWFGERVSSVMDINFNGHDISTFKGKGGLGIYSSRLMFEIPLIKNKVSLKIGGRTSYSDWLLTKMPDYYLKNSSASFADLNAMLSVNSKKNPITIFGYLSTDNFEYANRYSYKYGNQLLSINWQHLFNANFNTSATTSYSKYGLTSKNTENALTAYQVNSQISYFSGKFKAQYEGFYNQQVSAGIQAIGYSINPGNAIPLANSQAAPLNMQKELGTEYSAFINDVVKIGTRISFQLGFRYTLYQFLDANDHHSIQNYQGLEPRTSFKYLLGENNSIKASYNRNKQYLALLSYTSITTPEDVWKLADPTRRPVISDQVALGYYQNFLDNSYETSAEVYYKKLSNLTDYKNGAILKLNNNVTDELINASGTNYGIEFMVKKTSGKLNGTLSYTFSRALRKTKSQVFDERINNNEVYPSQYDIPHDLHLNLNYKYNRRVRLGLNFAYATGRPVTLPEYTYYLGTANLVYYSDRNKYRLPDYHRLDLSLSIDESLKKHKKWKGSWTFSVLNVYGRKNAYSIIYKQDTPTAENNYQIFSLYKMYLIGVPFPTITYNFIF